MEPSTVPCRGIRFFDRSKTGLPASGLGGSYLAHKEPNNAKLGFQPSWVDVNRFKCWENSDSEKVGGG